MSKSSFYENLSRDSKPTVTTKLSPPNPRLTAPIPIHPHQPTYNEYDQRKHSDDQMMVRRYYEHREQSPMSLPSLTHSLPPYQPPPSMPHHDHHNHHPSSQQEQKMARMERVRRSRDDMPYYDQPQQQQQHHMHHRISPPSSFAMRPPTAAAAPPPPPRDRYQYSYPPQNEGPAQYDRLAWRDEGPWLRISDSHQQQHQPPMYSTPKPADVSAPPETRHHASITALPPPRSPSTGSIASDRSSPVDYHAHEQQQQHPDNNGAHMKHPRLIRASANAPTDPKATAYPYRLPLGKTVHHTRRKKRDTKPPNANELRTIVELERDDHGQYKLPVEVDSWTVISLGKVVWDKPAFHNQRYIYPVGYVVKK